MTKPEGMLREAHWPSMAKMDSRTGDGRLLMSGGGGTRELPQTFSFQFHTDMGHLGAVPVGRVDQLIFDDDGNIEGWGWFIDSDEGRKAVLAVATQMQRGNSIELAEIKVDIDFDEDWNLLIDFVEWNFAGTVGVARPAFKDAEIELTDELTAAIFADETPLEMVSDFEIAFELKVPETTASMDSTVPWDDFHIPESEHPHKIVVDAEGRVYGNLAVWDEPHRGLAQIGQLRTAPRPRQGYTEFNHPGPLTEKGQVGTGPVFALGGHPKTSMIGKTQTEIHQAYGGIENAWADVRVSEGRFGPWVSGRVRPGLDDETLYAVRASHISGHWIGDDLVAIVSCNVPGFKPGAGFASVTDGRVVELVASFPAQPDAPSAIHVPSAMPAAGMSWPGMLTFTPTTLSVTHNFEAVVEETVEPVDDLAVARAKALLDLDE
jgi:hypothetical protein